MLRPISAAASAGTSAEEDAANAFIREVWGLQGAAYAILGIRYFAQVTFKRRVAWDDLFMVLATIAYTAESVAAYYVVAYWKGLANNGMTPEQREALDPDGPEWNLRVNGSKTHVIGLLLYMTVLWLLKGCWIAYYMRLTEGVPSKRRIVFWAAIIMPVTYVSCLLVAFLKCIPFERQWQINPEPPNACMPAITYIQTLYVMALNTLTDFLLMAIPVPMVWKASLPWKKKASLLIMFSGAFLEMAFGILRAVSVLTVGNSDPAQSGYWSVRESFVCFALTNMPMVYPLFKRFIEKSEIFSSNNQTSGLGESQGYRLGSYNRSGAGQGSRKAKNSHIDPTLDTVVDTGESTWGSKERIVPENTDKGVGSSASDEESLEGMGAPARVGSPGASYGIGHAATANRTTGVQGPESVVQGGKWRSGNRQIMVTTEYSVSHEGEGAQRQRPAESSHLGARGV